MNGTPILIEMPNQFEVEVIFGVPGDTRVPFYEALYEVRSRIRHIMAIDERCASFMADAYASLSHKPGICADRLCSILSIRPSASRSA